MNRDEAVEAILTDYGQMVLTVREALLKVGVSKSDANGMLGHATRMLLDKPTYTESFVGGMADTRGSV